MKDFIKLMISDDKGNISSLRICLVIMILYSIITMSYVIGIWSYVCLTTHTYQTLGWTELSTSLLGIVGFAAKAYQKKFELIEGDDKNV